jgi:hypothetical protein
MTKIAKAVSALLIGAFFAAGGAAAELKGDKKAVERANLMIDRLGGAEVWAEARSLYVEYEGWRSDPAQPVDERAWRSFDKPDQKLAFEGRQSDTIFHMTEEASWLEFSERPTRIFTEEEHAQNLAFWDFDFYTIIHNLARGDERMRLRFEEPRTVRLIGPDNADWGWFEIDETGQPIRWGAPDGDDQLEYIYGPVRAFGNVNFPAWGTARDGFWRFDYKTVDVSREPIPITLTPPAEQ